MRAVTLLDEIVAVLEELDRTSNATDETRAAMAEVRRVLAGLPNLSKESVGLLGGVLVAMSACQAPPMARGECLNTPIIFGLTVLRCVDERRAKKS